MYIPILVKCRQVRFVYFANFHFELLTPINGMAISLVFKVKSLNEVVSSAKGLYSSVKEICKISKFCE